MHCNWSINLTRHLICTCLWNMFLNVKGNHSECNMHCIIIYVVDAGCNSYNQCTHYYIHYTISTYNLTSGNGKHYIWSWLWTLHCLHLLALDFWREFVLSSSIWFGLWISWHKNWISPLCLIQFLPKTFFVRSCFYR